jgi:hypothetical protein
MKPIALPLFLLVFMPFFCLAQANYQAGTLVNLKGDTLKGFIEYKTWENNPKKINFKPDTTAGPIKYADKELKYFNVLVGYPVEYQQYSGRITTNDINISDLQIGRDTSFRIDTVLLKVIQRGKNLTLFGYTDGLKARYFIAKNPADQPTELIYRIYYNNEDENGYSRTKYENGYQNQLYNTAVEANVMTEDLKATISRSSYGESDILRIVSKINRIDENDQSKTNRKKFNPIIKVVAGAAALAVIIWTIQQFSTIKPMPTH